MGWGMVRWNEAAVGFYERLGATQNDDHVSYVLAGKALRRVARAQ
jgi:hypothetical protein